MADDSPSNLLHTPSQGFVDIKPIVDQPEWVIRASQYFLIILAVLLTYYLGRAIVNRLRTTQKANPVATPLEEFEKQVSIIKDENLSVREFSESLSGAVRTFCDASFFGGTETCISRTVSELGNILRAVIIKKLPVYPVAKKNEATISLLTLLQKLEDASYSDYAVKLDSLAWRNEIVDSVYHWVKNMALELDREYKRTLLVTESQNSQSSQNTTTALHTRTVKEDIA